MSWNSGIPGESTGMSWNSGIPGDSRGMQEKICLQFTYFKIYIFSVITYLRALTHYTCLKDIFYFIYNILNIYIKLDIFPPIGG
jgi:hypothetical protein